MEAQINQMPANSLDMKRASAALALGLVNLVWPPLQLAGMQVNAAPVFHALALVALFLSLVLGTTGVVLGIKALIRIKREPARYAGTARAAAGICLNLIVLLASAALVFVGMIFVYN